MIEENTHPTTQSEAVAQQQACSALVETPLADFTGFKFEHILLSVTIAHNRSIGQFDDSCAHQLQQAMMEYQGILMVDAQAQYKHCSEEQHTEGCECGLCAQVRRNTDYPEQNSR